jgi:tartrate-resistant acid phosphatase type 5
MRILLAICFLGAAACGAPDQPGDGDGDNALGSPPVKRTRFIAIGDAGKGNADQRRVAVALRDVCAQRGCDFVLMLGDNIYDSGVKSVTSPEWQTKFEQPYHDVDLPFYVALGNHDYGGKLIFNYPGLGNEFKLGKVEVDYTKVSTKWTLPATHYTFTWNHVGFIVLDTNSIMWSNKTYGDQAAWLPQAMLEVADKDWLFVVGHHPYRSNGSHGNAGNYDAPEFAGIPIPNPLPVKNGAAVKKFFDQHVCGLGQIYFSGHDHSRQWLDEPGELCGTQMIVSGAGATATKLRDRGNKTFYQDASKVGFMYVDVDDDRFTGTFYDGDGQVDFTRTFTK